MRKTLQQANVPALAPHIPKVKKNCQEKMMARINEKAKGKILFFIQASNNHGFKQNNKQNLLF